jgi:hypothetical protein
LTGVSSRISTTSLLPDEAAAWARAVRDNDDDLDPGVPPTSIGYTFCTSVQVPGALSRPTVMERRTSSVRGSSRVQQSRSIGILYGLQLFKLGICASCGEGSFILGRSRTKAAFKSNLTRSYRA